MQQSITSLLLNVHYQSAKNFIKLECVSALTNYVSCDGPLVALSLYLYSLSNEWMDLILFAH